MNPPYQPPYTYPPMPPKRNNTPLIIGGVLALVAIIAVVIVLVVSGNRTDIRGTWYSSQGGGFTVIFEDTTFTEILDSSSRGPVTGTYTVEGNILRITYPDGEVSIDIPILRHTATELVLGVGGEETILTRR